MESVTHGEELGGLGGSLEVVESTEKWVFGFWEVVAVVVVGAYSTDIVVHTERISFPLGTILSFPIWVMGNVGTLVF